MRSKYDTLPAVKYLEFCIIYDIGLPMFSNTIHSTRYPFRSLVYSIPYSFEIESIGSFSSISLR
jgi:hypothetical protein